MDKVKEMMHDGRPIKLIQWDDKEDGQYQVGFCGCTAIRAYGEPGSMAMVPWLAVYVGEEIVCRVAAHKVTVNYDLTPDPDGGE